MSALEIQVTVDDIAKGEPWAVSRCAIARAVRRSLGVKTRVEVRVGRRAILANDVTYLLPHDAAKWAERFDLSQKPLKPFSFVAEVIE